MKLDLEPDSEYQYRYLVNGLAWRNDPSADGYVRNPFGSDNSPVSTATVRRTPRTTSKERTAKPRSNRKTEGI